MPDPITRLFCRPGAERLYAELAEVYECDLDSQFDECPPDGWVVEEWTVAPPRSHLPTADRLIDHVLEHLEELDEYMFDAFENAARRTDAEAFLSAWAERVTYRMADQLVAEHRITMVDVPGSAEPVPFLNGAPMYAQDRPD